MATLYSDIITGLRASPQTKPDSGQSNGKVRCDVFSWTGDAAQNDLVELAKLPIGARIIYGFVDFTDFGTSITLDIGDGTTENKYLPALDVATAWKAATPPPARSTATSTTRWSSPSGHPDPQRFDYPLPPGHGDLRDGRVASRLGGAPDRQHADGRHVRREDDCRAGAFVPPPIVQGVFGRRHRHHGIDLGVVSAAGVSLTLLSPAAAP